MDDFVEDQPFTVGKMEGDQRRFYKNRPLAQQYANRGQQLFDQVISATVEFEPDHGFVAVLHTDANIPSAWDEGYEVRSGWQPAKTPPDWTDKKKSSSGTSGTSAAPSKGATARVWAIADEITEKLGGTIDRAKIIEACVAAGINKATASTQYSKWKKAKS